MYIDWREVFADRDDDVNTRKPTKSVCVCWTCRLCLAQDVKEQQMLDDYLSQYFVHKMLEDSNRDLIGRRWLVTNGAMGPIWPKAHQAKSRRPACVSKDTGRWTSFCLACFLLS